MEFSIIGKLWNKEKQCAVSHFKHNLFLFPFFVCFGAIFVSSSWFMTTRGRIWRSNCSTRTQTKTTSWDGVTTTLSSQQKHTQFDFCHLSLAVSQCFCSDDKFYGMILIIQSSNKSFSTILAGLNLLVKWFFVWLLPECAVETPTVFWWANDRCVFNVFQPDDRLGRTWEGAKGRRGKVNVRLSLSEPSGVGRLWNRAKWS